MWRSFSGFREARLMSHTLSGGCDAFNWSGNGNVPVQRRPADAYIRPGTWVTDQIADVSQWDHTLVLLFLSGLKGAAPHTSIAAARSVTQAPNAFHRHPR